MNDLAWVIRIDGRSEPCCLGQVTHRLVGGSVDRIHLPEALGPGMLGQVPEQQAAEAVVLPAVEDGDRAFAFIFVSTGGVTGNAHLL
ncbi:hypothetical protein D3C72_2281870 [compost metagenome]